MDFNSAAARPSRVRFENPPVAEVACGVLFTDIPSLRTPHFGLFWDTVRDSFPRVEEAPPLDPAIEGPIEPRKVKVEFHKLPPIRRCWFLDAPGSHLIQLQNDRFLFNWKRTNQNGAYPSYDAVIAQFDRRLDEYLNFLQSEHLESPSFRQFELTYINIIGKDNGLEGVGDGSIFVDHIRKQVPSRFLPNPDSYTFTTSYPLPQGWGRLHVSIHTAILLQSNEPVIRMELTARGIPPNDPRANRRKWFDLAHEWITFGFADLTTEAAQRIWRRTS